MSEKCAALIDQLIEERRRQGKRKKELARDSYQQRRRNPALFSLGHSSRAREESDCCFLLSKTSYICEIRKNALENHNKYEKLDSQGHCICPHFGTRHNLDENAAINIQRE